MLNVRPRRPTRVPCLPPGECHLIPEKVRELQNWKTHGITWEEALRRIEKILEPLPLGPQQEGGDERFYSGLAYIWALNSVWPEKPPIPPL